MEIHQHVNTDCLWYLIQNSLLLSSFVVFKFFPNVYPRKKLLKLLQGQTKPPASESESQRPGVQSLPIHIWLPDLRQVTPLSCKMRGTIPAQMTSSGGRGPRTMLWKFSVTGALEPPEQAWSHQLLLLSIPSQTCIPFMSHLHKCYCCH